MTSVTIFDEYYELTDEQVDFLLDMLIRVNESVESPTVDQFIESFKLDDTFVLDYSPPMTVTKKPKNRKPVKRSVKRCKDTIDWVESLSLDSVDELCSSVEALNQASVDEYSLSGGNNEN